jgi:pimeloyl-ACP methyl ester carboxylesterase
VAGTDANGSRYELRGSGPALVLVHGLGLNHAMWRWLMPQLESRYTVLSYDLSGHGKTAPVPGHGSMAAFVTQLRALVDFTGLDRFALAGFSLGGMIAQAFTLESPQRVRALAVLHSAFDRSDAERAAILERVALAEAEGPQATIGKALQRWFTAGFAAMHPEVLDLVRDWVTTNDRQAFAAAYRLLALVDGPLAARTGEIACPALVVTGEEDFGNSPDMARRMAARMQQADCRILPGLRHMALAEDPAAMLAELLPFFDRTAGH